MAKISNVVRMITFTSEEDLWKSLDKVMQSYSNDSDQRCYRVKDLKLIDKTHALVYLEEDLESVRVHFFYCDNEIIPSESPYESLFFSYKEVELMNTLGIVTISDTEYGIEDIKYCIDEFGVRFIEICLN